MLRYWREIEKNKAHLVVVTAFLLATVCRPERQACIAPKRQDGKTKIVRHGNIGISDSYETE
jgi:hypothetical protein